jgi:1,4-alpha-glucan branching enzyme
MYAQPGKKLFFMGGELGQWREWNHDENLDWHLLQYQRHADIQNWVRALNQLYASEPALHELDCDPAGFEWVDASDFESSVISFIRKGKSASDSILVVGNFTPRTHFHYRIGVPRGGYWKELLNSDGKEYGGSGKGNPGRLRASPVSCHGRRYSLDLTLSPLSVMFFKKERKQS